MGTLVWNADLATGIAEIDTQHKRIVAYVNRLQELKQSHDRAALGELIGEAVDYTMSHFAFEEELMELAGYHFTGPHRKVHQLFTRKVGEMQARFDAGEDVAEDLHGVLSRWLFNHILHEDRGYVDTVKAHLRRTAKPQETALPPEVMSEMKRRGKRGWFARLFGH